MQDQLAIFGTSLGDGLGFERLDAVDSKNAVVRFRLRCRLREKWISESR
jgi:hypothetical protein